MRSVSIASPDVTLVLDTGGVIRNATLSGVFAQERIGDWLGRPWPETVGGAGGEGVRRIVEDARQTGISAFHNILQRFPSGLEIPIEYTTVRINGRRSGLLALGKNLQAVAELQARLTAAQQATEREYWKLRDVESRYRLLFDSSTEAVLTIGGDELQIQEANPAAVRALGLAPGWNFVGELLPGERDGFRAALARAREEGRAPGIIVRLGAAREPWVVRPSLMAADSGLRYLLQVSPASGGPIGLAAAAPVPVPVLLPGSADHLIERLPDAFVVIDPAGAVVRANLAFLDLVQAGAEGAVVGQSLGRWLYQPGADVAGVLAQVHKHRTVRLLSTTIQGELGTVTPVELSAAADADGQPQHVGVLLRDVSRRLIGPGGEAEGRQTPQVDLDKLGQVPLLELVRDASDAVERTYIAAALVKVGGNRTAAADLLGLSRQSLHSKLNRYEIGTAGAKSDHRD